MYSILAVDVQAFCELNKALYLVRGPFRSKSRSWQCKLETPSSSFWHVCGRGSSSDPAMIPAGMNYAWDPATDYPYQYAILITLLKLPLNSYEYVEKCRGLI